MGVRDNGQVNTLVVTEADVLFETGAFFDITEIHIVLTDGDQYSPTLTNYDYMSISERVTL